ncbi:CGNR zinc finger domain-containing protein [Streptomyces sp. V4I2]|uniref:CGNR zinc finger domain-containing protein n=1 Tax=Streptomyces sp. V4I2 TaxID=3042280 RepID=UPI0035942A31
MRLLDRSPADNRRRCSMPRCGNRTKVRLDQARDRRSGHTARRLSPPPDRAHDEP